MEHIKLINSMNNKFRKALEVHIRTEKLNEILNDESTQNTPNDVVENIIESLYHLRKAHKMGI